MPHVSVILAKHDNPDADAAAIEQAVRDWCRVAGVRCLVIPPLYHIAEASKLWQRLAGRVDNAILLCWLHPRPAHWLLHRHQLAIAEACILDLHTVADAVAASEVLANLTADKMATKRGGAAQQDAVACETLHVPTRTRWYPVLDESRCIHCGHCFQFCLFGVYTLEQGRVRVRHPDQCKPGCPACARICPQSAIMFPRHEKDLGIAGAPGVLVAPDPAARRMFYLRTEQACPVCGQKAARKSSVAAAAPLCAECGQPLPTDTSTPAASAAEKPAFDDLDLLVDQLDRAMQRRD